jgi:hypothetical protein
MYKLLSLLVFRSAGALKDPLRRDRRAIKSARVLHNKCTRMLTLFCLAFDQICRPPKPGPSLPLVQIVDTRI